MEIQKDISKIQNNIIILSKDIFKLQNDMKKSGIVFNNKVFNLHKEKSINRLSRILRYAQKVNNLIKEI